MLIEEQETELSQSGKKTQWISWNDPLCFLHMIPVINGHGAQWFGVIEVAGNSAIYILIEINGEDFMHIAEKLPCTTSQREGTACQDSVWN